MSRIVTFLSLCFLLVNAARADLTFVFNSPADIAATAPGYAATGSLNLTLNFQPVPGQNLTVVKNTGTSFISGTFDGIPQGATVPLAFNGVTCNYIANYYGGNGRSLVLHWPDLQIVGWGSESGLQGNATIGYGASPSLLANEGGLTGKPVLATSPGGDYSLALTSDGKIYAWGSNGVGQLGDGTQVPKTVPVEVDASGALAGKTVVAIAAGSAHSLALTADGLVFAWGANYYGNLGDGTTQTRLTPVAVQTSGALAGKTVVAIAAGQKHSMALTSEGRVVAWGYGLEGQLGNGGSDNQLSPVAVDMTGVLAGKVVTGISAGFNHSVAVAADGTVATWGFNTTGQLGNNSTSPSPVPVVATGSLAGKTVTQVRAGANFNLALTSDGQVHAWGSNGSGQLGIGSTTNSLVPALAGGSLSGNLVISIGAGNAHATALTADGQPHVWGSDGYGELGNGVGPEVSALVPGLVPGLGPAAGRRVAAVFSGANRSHALTDPGPPQIRVHPFDLAANAGATARFTAAASHPFPTTVQWQMSATGAGGTFLDITNEPSATTGTLVLGELGPIPEGAAFRAVFSSISGDATSNPAVLHKTVWPATFSDASGPLSTVKAASVAGNLDPVLNFEPTPGTHLTLIRSIGPAPVSGRFANIPQGSVVPLTYQGVTYHYIANYYGENGSSLVLQWPTNKVYGWGRSTSGLLGNISSQTLPIEIPTGGVLAGKTITTISHTGGHVLALTSDGRVFAWGENGNGQLGNGVTTDSSQPVAVDGGALAGQTVVAVSAGSLHSLALTAEGRVITWGQLRTGHGIKPNSLLPIELSPGGGPLASETVVAISAGGSFDLALTAGGEIYGLGSDNSGQLGSYDTQYRPEPVLIGKGEIGTRLVTAVAAGGDHALALTEDGKVYAWGSNQYGALGIGNNTPGFHSPIPIAVVSNGALAGRSVTAIAAVSSRSMVLTNDGRAFGWGISWNGELGNGNTAGSLDPVPVESSGVLAGKFLTTLACGSSHTAVLASDGSISAWGDNGNGELGYPGWNDSLVPVIVSSEVLAGAIPTALGAGWNTNLVLAGHGAPAITRHPLDLMAAAGQTATFSASAEDTFPFSVKWQVSPNGVTGPFSDIVGETNTLTIPAIIASQEGWAYRAVFISAAGERATDPAVLRVVEWSATLSSGAAAPFSAERVLASGTLDFHLGFAPAIGTNLKLIENAGPAFIGGTFENLSQGEIINLTYNGVTYPFLVNYHGGNGRSLVLQWPWTALAAWGSSYGTSPVSVATRPALATKTLTAMKAGNSHQLVLTADGKVFGWGSNGSGQLGNTLTTSSQVPVPVKDDGVLAGKVLAAIATGTSHNLALSTDGELFSWGNNFNGQLGDGSKVNRTQPVAVIADGALAGKTITAIAAGNDFSLALTADGEIFAWGSNLRDQLGSENWQDSLAPVALDTRGALRGKTVVAIAAGYFHSLALTSDGEVIAWGENTNGKLGNGENFNPRIPVRVDPTGALAGKRVVAMTAGEHHSVALTADGLVFAWGSNWYGQLGNNSAPTNSHVPVAVATDGILAGKPVTGISSGLNHCLAVTAGGEIVAWGANSSGQLGNGSSVTSPVPVAVVSNGILAGATVHASAAVSTKSFALLGVAGAPFVTAVPQNRSFIVGAGAAAVSASFSAAALDPLPVSIQWQEAGPTGDFSNITNHPSAGTPTLQIDGLTTAADGRRYRAVFSNAGGSTTTIPATLKVAFAESPVVFQNANEIPFTAESPTLAGSLNIALGFAPVPGVNLTLVRNTGGNFLSGNFTDLVHGAEIQLGFGGVNHAFVIDYFGGNGRSLVLRWANNLPAAWGAGSAGQVGDGSNLTSNRTSVAVTTSGAMAGQTVVKMAAGTSHSLALASSGRIFAWGSNGSGRLGDGSTVTSNVPVEVDATGELAGKQVAAIAAGGAHSLALTADGQIAAWGLNSAGQLGSGGSSGGSSTPVAVSRAGVLAGKTVTSIAAGQFHSVALLSDGTLAAWGFNTSGQLGDGSNTLSVLPVAVNAVADSPVVAIAAGVSHTLALTADGRVFSWGSNQYGQLGTGWSYPAISSSPVAVAWGGWVAGQAAIAIAAGANHSLVLTANGGIYAWGLGSQGQLGNGSTSSMFGPVEVNTTGVLSGKTLVAISAGGSHSLAIDSNGFGYGWGGNSNGQLGNSNTNSTNPTPVAFSTLGATGNRPLVAIAAGGSHSLGIAAKGTAPAVSQSPAPLTVAAGSTVTFTAAADGYPSPAVRWQRSTTGPAGSFTDLANQTTPTLQLTNVLVSQTGYAYRAVFTNLEASSNSAAATLTVQPTLGSFLVSLGLAADAPSLEDPYHTGIPHLLAYAFNLNPATPERAKLPTLTSVDGHLRISYTRWKDATDLRYTAEVSNALGNWLSGPGVTEIVSVTSLDNARETVVEQETLPDPSPARFLRVRVELDP